MDLYSYVTALDSKSTHIKSTLLCVIKTSASIVSIYMQKNLRYIIYVIIFIDQKNFRILMVLFIEDHLFFTQTTCYIA